MSAHAGIEMHAGLGDHLTYNQPLITLYTEDEALLGEAFRLLEGAIRITPDAPVLQPLICDVIARNME